MIEELQLTEELGTYMFPDGCPYCGGEILFKSFNRVFGEDARKDRYVYVCENYPQCNSYTRAHTESKGDAIQYHPQGIIADEKLRSAHELLRIWFARLWDEGEIKRVYPVLVLACDVDGDPIVGEFVEFNKKRRDYTLETEDGTLVLTPTIKRIDYRSKSYFWLSKQLGIPYKEAKIPLFDYDTTIKAREIIEAALC